MGRRFLDYEVPTRHHLIESASIYVTLVAAGGVLLGSAIGYEIAAIQDNLIPFGDYMGYLIVGGAAGLAAAVPGAWANHRVRIPKRFHGVGKGAIAFAGLAALLGCAAGLWYVHDKRYSDEEYALQMIIAAWGGGVSLGVPALFCGWSMGLLRNSPDQSKAMLLGLIALSINAVLGAAAGALLGFFQGPEAIMVSAISGLIVGATQGATNGLVRSVATHVRREMAE